MSIFYLEILKPTIERQILPVISDTVQALVSHMDLRKACTLDEVEELLELIHERVCMQLFQQDAKTAPESSDMNRSYEQSDSEEE